MALQADVRRREPAAGAALLASVETVAVVPPITASGSTEEYVATSAATADEACAKADDLRREFPARTFGVLAYRDWHGKPFRTRNPWLVVGRRYA